MHAILAVLVVAALGVIGRRGVGMRSLGIAVLVFAIAAALVALPQLVDLPSMFRTLHPMLEESAFYAARQALPRFRQGFEGQSAETCGYNSARIVAITEIPALESRLHPRIHLCRVCCRSDSGKRYCLPLCLLSCSIRFLMSSINFF